jgi:hypothetical protein
MADTIIQKGLPASVYHFSYKLKQWDFNPGGRNSDLRSMLASPPVTLALTSSALRLCCAQAGLDYQVNFDSQGNVLRGNGLPYLRHGRQINAFKVQEKGRKIPIPFWELVLERDRAPIETRREFKLKRFNPALTDFIEEAASSLFMTYLRARTGKRGEIELGPYLLWGITLRRHYPRQSVILVPQLKQDKFYLDTFSPDGSSFIGSFSFDFEEGRFYSYRNTRGWAGREYFVQVPADRRFTLFGTDFYLNNRTTIGDILVAWREGDAVKIKQGEQAKPYISFPVRWQGRTSAYILGETCWPRREIPISGRLEKGLKLRWHKLNQCYAYEIFGKLYYLSIQDVNSLKLHPGEKIFAHFEDGKVVCVEAKSSGRFVYNYLVRDNNWRLLFSSRRSIPDRFLKDNIMILEGLETVKNQNTEGIIFGNRFIGLQRAADGPFRRRPVSLVVRIAGGTKRVLYYCFSSRFSAEDRGAIDQLILKTQTSPTLSEWRKRSLSRRQELTTAIAVMLDEHLSQKEQCDRLIAYLSGRDITAEDVFNLLDIIYLGAMNENKRVAGIFLNVFVCLHGIIANLSAKDAIKVRSVFSLMNRYPETRDVLQLIMNNGLSVSRELFKRLEKIGS